MNRRNFYRKIIALLVGTAAASSATPARAKKDRQLLLLETSLAGFQFYAGEALFTQLAAAQPLTLRRDPENRYDENAVEILWREHKLGYLPKADNRVIAQMLDRGGKLEAKILKLRAEWNPWRRVELRVYWEG